jgi:hypothetical protein
MTTRAKLGDPLVINPNNVGSHHANSALVVYFSFTLEKVGAKSLQYS